MESPDFTVPDVCSMEPIRSIVSQSCSGLPSGLELTRPAKRHSVFISDSDSSKDCSPGEFQANCIAGKTENVGMNMFSGEVNLSKMFLPPFYKGSYSKRNNFFPFIVDPFSEGVYD